MIRFIHIPKTAGQSITTWLEENEVSFLLGRGKKFIKGRDKYKDVHQMSVNYILENVPRFAVVRNPYDRFVSYYNYISKVSSPDRWNITFEEFVLDKEIEITTRIPSPWKPQNLWVCDNQGNVIVDNILYFENLEEELQNLFKINNPLSRINVSNSTNYKDYYNEELQSTIYNHFKEDFEIFNYSESIDLRHPTRRSSI